MKTSNRILKTICATAAAIIFAGVPGPACAGDIAYVEAGTLKYPKPYPGALPNENPYGRHPVGISGFNFTVKSPIKVVRLGYNVVWHGEHQDVAPAVGLWDLTDEKLLGQVNVGPWPGQRIEGPHWVYETLETPVTLTPGHTYQVSASSYWGFQYVDSEGFTFGDAINPVGFTTVGTGAKSGDRESPEIATELISDTPTTVVNFEYEEVPEPVKGAPAR